MFIVFLLSPPLHTDTVTSCFLFPPAPHFLFSFLLSRNSKKKTDKRRGNVPFSFFLLLCMFVVSVHVHRERARGKMALQERCRFIVVSERKQKKRQRSHSVAVSVFCFLAEWDEEKFVCLLCCVFTVWLPGWFRLSNSARQLTDFWLAVLFICWLRCQQFGVAVVITLSSRLCRWKKTCWQIILVSVGDMISLISLISSAAGSLRVLKLIDQRFGPEKVLDCLQQILY